MIRKIYFDDGAKGVLILLLISQLIFTNGIILFAGMLIFFYLFINLQQPFKPAVFTVMLFYHFLQISASIWLSNYLGKDINYRSPSTMNAVIVSFIGLLFLFLPIIYYQNKIPIISLDQFKKHAAKLSIDKTFKIYVICFFSISTLVGLASQIAGLVQIVYSLANIKWFLFLLFGFQSIVKNKRRKEFYFFCFLEFFLGFFSYFSDFKTIIFFILFLSLFFLVSVKFNHVIVFFFSIVFMFFAGVGWTSVKSEYRVFLNKGSNTQSVQVEQSDALNKLLELSQKQDEISFSASIVSFFERLQYTYNFAKAMDRVPEQVPYQDGANWGSTLTFVLTPRLINPDKGTYDASIKATKYTGVRYAGVKKGTSVSLGYFADGYIDFGYVGMFIPILILGFIYGKSYYFFIKKSSSNYVFNISVVGALFMELFAFESDNIFVFGRLYVNLMVFFLLKRFVFRALMNYIKAPVIISKD